MKVRGILKLAPLFLAAVPCVYAQFTVNGCPDPSQPVQINGFTAGTTAPSQICLNGTFGTSLAYNVTLTDPNTLATANVSGAAQGNLLVVTVPAAFYATVSTPGQADPVNIVINAPSQSGSTQTGTFQINPPLQQGGPVFVSAVNSAVQWTMYTGGTAPYENEFNNGSVPNGMPSLPASSPVWGGTPTQSGVFQFSIIPTDAWGNEITANLAAYITPKPNITTSNPTYGVVGPSIPVNIIGTGFLSPISIGSTPEPGSSVLWVQGSNTITLTPTSYSSTQLTVNVPTLTASGGYAFIVVNPGPNGSNGVLFTVDPSITALSTYYRTAGAPPVQLGVTGTGFVSGSSVQINGNSIPTTYVNGSTLTVTIPTISALGTDLVTVLNPDSTVTPVPQDLIVVAGPTIGALQPSSINAGSPGFTLTVMGASFLTGSTVYFNGVPVSTIVVSNQKNNTLMALIPASLILTPGTVPVTVATSDGYYSASMPFIINSTGPPPLQLLTFSPLPSGMVNSAYSTTFSASQGAGGYTFSLTGGTLPAGLTLAPSGLLSGTPTAYGTSQFIVTLTDSADTTIARNFSLTIAPQPLTLTTGPLASTQVNTPLSVQFAGSGGIPPYTFVEFGALPPGVSISSTGLLSGTPTKAGTYPFLLFINDTTQASAHQNYTLNVALPGLLITPANPLPSGQINVPYTTTLAASGGAGAPYVWYATGLPQGLTIANNSGLIAGIPRASGTFTVGITVGDSSGATISQNYTLVIASATLTLSTPGVPNGTVGSSYSGVVTATGGSGTYTFTATGLPAGITLSSTGVLSGTPTTAGTFTVGLTATDATGLTASSTFKITIGAQLVVTPTTIPATVVGTPITTIQLTATGGTPPYQWQSATVPPGLSLALNGTLSGTPTAAGSFSFTVFVVDSNGSLSSGTEKLTVGLPTTAAATIGGLPPSAAPATQQFVQVSLSNPYPATVTANLTLTFTPTSGADDPSIQFATGGRTAQIVIPAGSTAGATNVGVQTGTVAGVITITAQLLAGTTNVTPTPAPSQSITITAGAPVITGVTATRTATGFTVMVTGYASNRDVDSGTYQFSASDGSSLATNQLSTTITPLFTQWYGSSTSAPFGSQFTLTQPFTVNGSSSSVLSVTVTLTNTLGTSQAASAILQ